MLISFEGIDYSGKSTQVHILKNKLSLLNKKVISVREPGGCIISEKIRQLIINNHNTLSLDCELLLFLAARAQLLNEIILPKLKENYIVLCDRFIDSTIAYQHYGKNIPIEIILNINNYLLKNLTPDITFLINIPTEEVKKRMSRSERQNNPLDNKELEFLEKVNKGFIKLAEEYKNRFFILNGLDTIENISNKIFSIVTSKLS